MNKQVISEDEYNAFSNSNISAEAKEKMASNVNKGLALDDALESPHGKALTADMNCVLMESLSKIMMFKHDDEKSLRQNYDKILTLILEHNTALKVKSRWESILRTKEDSLQRIKNIGTKYKPNNGGYNNDR